MNKTRISFITAVTIISFLACAPVRLLVPTQADAQRGAQTYPGYTLEDLDHGKALFERDCTTCHRLRDPASRSADKWNKIVPRMVAKANKKAGKEVIDDRSKDLILKYLVTMSTAPKEAK